MTQFSRRRLLRAALAAGAAGAPAAAFAADRTSTAGLIEPAMRLKARSPAGVTTVALTFDACPGSFDHRVADTLVRNNVPATIFVTGAWIRRNPDAAAFLMAHPEIFALENHGDEHIPPVLGSRRIFGIKTGGEIDAIRREVRLGARDVQQLSGAAPRWYRASTGFYSPEVMDEIEAWDFSIGAYSLNADQGASLPAATVAKRLAAAADGDVIVSHINQPHRSSGQGVAAGIEALVARRVRFVRLDHLDRTDVVYQLKQPQTAAPVPPSRVVASHRPAGKQPA